MPIHKIHYITDADGYCLTACPHGREYKNGARIRVGSTGCSCCPYYVNEDEIDTVTCEAP